MSKKNVVRVIVFGTLGMILALVVLHPGNWQYVFGPKVRGQTLYVWQNEFRVQHDPGWVAPWQAWIKAKTGITLGGNAVTYLNGVPDHKDYLLVFHSLFNDPSSVVRLKARQMYCHHAGLDDAVPIIIEGLQSTNIFERRSAVINLSNVTDRVRFRNLGTTKPNQLQEVLLKDLAEHPGISPLVADGTLILLMEDTDPLIRWPAFEVVPRLVGPDKRVDKLLRGALESNLVNDRIIALGPFCARFAHSEDEFNLVCGLFKSEASPSVRIQILYNLHRFGDQSLNILLEYADDSAKELRLAALRSLANLAIKSPAVLKNLVQLRDENRFNERRFIEGLLHEIDSERFAAPARMDEEDDKLQGRKGP